MAYVCGSVYCNDCHRSFPVAVRPFTQRHVVQCPACGRQFAVGSDGVRIWVVEEKGD